MGFSWTAAEDGGGTVDKIPAGHHRLTVSKVVTGSKTGGTFESRKGDPQIMLIFEDVEGREASQMYTLSSKAAWTLAILLSRIGETKLSELDKQGIVPANFANKDFAESYLLNKSIWANVYYETGTDDKEYSRIEPLKEEEVDKKVLDAVAVGGQHKPLGEESIPF